jgi:hypothetical protein
MPLSGAEFEMRWAAMQEERKFRDRAAAGEIVVRDVLGKDNTPSPDYSQPDPFFSMAGRSGGGVMRFADVERPDLGELPV